MGRPTSTFSLRTGFCSLEHCGPPPANLYCKNDNAVGKLGLVEWFDWGAIATGHGTTPAGHSYHSVSVWLGLVSKSNGSVVGVTHVSGPAHELSLVPKEFDM